MKKLFLLASVVAFMASCEKDVNIEPETFTAKQRSCAAQEILDAQIKENPSLALKMDEIERFTDQAIAEKKLVNGVIVIPVYFNVLYNTSAQNVSLAQLESQVKILTDDFNALNNDLSGVNNTVFSNSYASVGVKFEYAGVTRKSTKKTSWRLDDSMKKTSRGGIDPTSPATTLNIWVCNLASGYLGYAQFPGGSLATDGVVIDDNALGNTGTAAYPFNLGRTATHEVGHWMNLRHIWGDATCGNDFVADTPSHNTANYGAPVYPHRSTCAGTPIEMTMNYMDYTDDRAMYMFSNNQKDRMLAIFAAGGPRASFAQ